MAVVAWPPPTPPNTRANSTLQVDAHPSDHNRIADALDTIIARLTPLADVAVTAPVTISATAAAAANTVASSGAVTFDGTAVWLEFSSPHAQVPNVAGGTMFVTLWDGSTDLGQLAAIYAAGTVNVGLPVMLRRKLTPTAGSHTYTVRAYVSPSGTGTVQAGNGGAGAYVPATLRIVRA